MKQEGERGRVERYDIFVKIMEWGCEDGATSRPE
jgi:hypothetical protein